MLECYTVTKGDLMRVECPECEKPAHVKKRNKLSKHVTDVYGCCSDPFCGATFVTTIAFKNLISPPANQANALLKQLILQMGDEDYQDIISARRAS